MINIFEYINDYFAFPKHQILADATFKVETINKHLIKLKLFESSRDFEHWKDEISEYLMEISRHKIKGNIKVKPEKYFELLFTHPIEPKEPYHDSYLWFMIRDLLHGKKHSEEFSKYRNKNKTNINTTLIDILYDALKTFSKSISDYMSARKLTYEIIEIELDQYIKNIRVK